MMYQLPLARIPLNCFLALVASAAVSNEMMATPDERPLRSYLKCAKMRIERGRNRFASGELGVFGGSYPDYWLANERANLSKDGL
jgi:hypothetical protein